MTITPDMMVKFLHNKMADMSRSISHARQRGLRLESIEKEHDMHAAVKHFIITHEDSAAVPERTKDVLGKLISWIAQSANTPISVCEAQELLDELYRTKKRRATK